MYVCQLIQANMSLYLNMAGGRHVVNTLSAIERVFDECTFWPTSFQMFLEKQLVLIKLQHSVFSSSDNRNQT